MQSCLEADTQGAELAACIVGAVSQSDVAPQVVACAAAHQEDGDRDALVSCIQDAIGQ